MAALPQSLDLASVQGALPSTETVRPTDFGLGQAAAETGQVAAADFRLQRFQQMDQMRADQQTVAPALFAAKTANDTAITTAASDPNGIQPGFAQDQMKAAQARGEVAYDDASNSGKYTPDQLDVLQRGLMQENSRAGNTALAHEQAIAQQNAGYAAAARRSNLLSTGQQAWGPAQQQLIENNDGSQPGKLTADTGTAFDAAWGPVLANASPADKPYLQAQLAEMRTQAITHAAPIDAHQAIGYVHDQVVASTDKILDGLVANPGTYAETKVPLDAAIAAAPPQMQAQLKAELYPARDQAYVKGLIIGGHADLAMQALKSGDLTLPKGADEELLQSANNALLDKEPRTPEQAAAQQQLRQRAEAAAIEASRTGQLPGNVDQLEAQLGSLLPAREAAQLSTAIRTAPQTYAAVSSVSAMNGADLAHAASAPMPTDGDPANLQHWQLIAQAAQKEQAARAQDMGAWAWGNARSLQGGKNGQGVIALNDRGAPLQQAWQGVLTAPTPQARAQAGQAYVARMIGQQDTVQTPATAYAVLPQAAVVSMVKGVQSAAPEQRAAVMENVGQTVLALPSTYRTASGLVIHPRDMLMGQLARAGANPMDLSVLADYSNNDAGMQRYVAATLNPGLKKALPGPDGKSLVASVQSNLQPYFQSQQGLPGQADLQQARTDRTVLVARQLMETQGLGVEAAAKAASNDLTAGYRYMGSWRMPEGLANAPSQHGNLNTFGTGGAIQDVRIGAAKTLADLTDGHGLLGGSQQATPQAVHDHAVWKPTADGTGLQLLMPSPTKGMTPVKTQWGENVQATWQQLQNRAGLLSQPQFGASRPAPPGTVHTDAGQPVPAATTSQAFSAFTRAIEMQESGGRNGQVSSAGAVGVRQLTQPFVQTYASRAGLPVDMARAQTDPAYSRTVSDVGVRDLLSRYNGNYALAAIGYNAGPGVLDGYHDKQGGYHPGLLSTVGDPRKPGGPSYQALIGHLPAETQNYVRPVLARTIQYLHPGA